ncbi:MAG: hypothetical protein H6841_07875 [Planctomycetes bacterium]|nr:hypothetical protein [Planctomycetota bacterium]MCB9935487.1 hypothetical protein [Planctomycetota bacterium]
MQPADYKPFAPEVHEYVDGRMSAEAERDFERRLQANPELKRQVDALRRSIELLGNLPVQQPREGFDKRVFGRIREEELAERARKQIIAAPMPLWQHVVHVGLGAAAAALVFAIIGLPGLFSGESDNMEGSGGEAPIARVTATEDDLLPALADHKARFDTMRRNVAATRVDDPDLQRQLIAMELQYSDLGRRNMWLAQQVSGLPSGKRGAYEQYLARLDAALVAVNEEITRSRTERKPMDMDVVRKALAGVPTPTDQLGEYRISVRGASPLPESDVAAMADDGQRLDEITLYSLVRQADYRHDHAAVIEAADFYLKWQNRGRFTDQANAAAIAAHLRLGRDLDAGRRFRDKFGDYDEDLQPGQLELVRGLLTEAEFNRLQAARAALRE